MSVHISEKKNSETVLYTEIERKTVFNHHFSSHPGIKYLLLCIIFDYKTPSIDEEKYIYFYFEVFIWKGLSSLHIRSNLASIFDILSGIRSKKIPISIPNKAVEKTSRKTTSMKTWLHPGYSCWINEARFSPIHTSENTVSAYDNAQEYLVCYTRLHEILWAKYGIFMHKLQVLQNVTRLLSSDIYGCLWYPQVEDTEKQRAEYC